MKMNYMAIWASMLGLALAGCATQKTDSPEAWGGAVVGQLQKKAVVQNVDYRTREVTVKDEAGEISTMVAGPVVRNFNQINPGDKVALQYRESVTIAVMKGVDVAPTRAETVDVAGAPPGEKPAGVIVRTGEVVAEVIAINHKDRTVTLKGPARTLTVQVNTKDKGFNRLTVGDKVYLRLASALAVAVTAE